MSRVRCPQCHLASQACVCRYIQQQENHFPLLILQHPDEKDKPLGTAKLIQLGLSNCDVITELKLSRQQCYSALGKLGIKSPLLLHHMYRPAHSADVRIDLSTKMSVPPFTDTNKTVGGFILMDGTFRNVRELFLANEWLNEIPRLVFQNASPSRYRLRKSQVENAMSSIEAVAEILKRVEVSFSEELFLHPFDKMIEYQIQRMGLETFQRNYTS